MLGSIIDTAFIRRTAIQVFGAATTAIPILVAVLDDGPVDEDPTTATASSNATGATCATMSAAQLAGMEAVRLANTSCMYNISIGPAGVILH